MQGCDVKDVWYDVWCLKNDACLFATKEQKKSFGNYQYYQTSNIATNIEHANIVVKLFFFYIKFTVFLWSEFNNFKLTD